MVDGKQIAKGDMHCTTKVYPESTRVSYQSLSPRFDVEVHLPVELTTGSYPVIAFAADADKALAASLKYFSQRIEGGKVRVSVLYGQPGASIWADTSGSAPLTVRFSELPLIESAEGVGQAVATISGAIQCQQIYK